MTSRDTEILQQVNRYRFLRSQQIVELIGGSRQQVLRRIQALYHHGYLQRPRCQLDYFESGGSKSIVHGLASRGIAHLRRVADVPFDRIHWDDNKRSPKRIFLEHALMVSEFMVRLELSCRRRSDVHLLLNHEIPLPSVTDPVKKPFQWTVTLRGRERVGVVPDCVFALVNSSTGKHILNLLEADRGTMPIKRARLAKSSIARKLCAYSETWKSGIHRSRFGFSRMRVLFITSTQQRCENIRNAAAAASLANGLFLHSAVRDSKKPVDYLGAVWLDVAGRIVALKD